MTKWNSDLIKKIKEVQRINPNLTASRIRYRLKHTDSFVDVCTSDRWICKKHRTKYFVVENGVKMSLGSAVRLVSNNKRYFSGNYFKFHKIYKGLNIQQCYELWKENYIEKWEKV